MTYLPSFLTILTFSLLGEVLQRVVPLPIPASVYGLVLLFAALCTGVVKAGQVREVGRFLTSLLPLLFVSPVAGLLDNWALVESALLPLLILTAASTLLTFFVSGKTAQKLLQKEESHDPAA